MADIGMRYVGLLTLLLRTLHCLICKLVYNDKEALLPAYLLRLKQ
jgi:hypothetical protein